MLWTSGDIIYPNLYIISYFLTWRHLFELLKETNPPTGGDTQKGEYGVVPLMAGQMPVVVVSPRLSLAKPQHQKERSLLAQGISKTFRPASSSFSVVASSSPAILQGYNSSVGAFSATHSLWRNCSTDRCG